MEQGQAPEHLQCIDGSLTRGRKAEDVFEKGKKFTQILLKAGFAIDQITNSCLGNPSAFSPGNNQSPVLYLNASSAQEGEIIFFQCAIDWQFPATRVVFCKYGLEEFSLKAQQGKVIYALVLNITSRSAGTYKCGYQQRNESNWVRNSALSAPQTLSVPGSSPSHKAQLPSRGSAMPLEVWILRSALSLLLLLSAPIITLLLERCSHGAREARQPGDIPVPTEL
ncbi:uncharacterized protein [Anas platyrhynchos]|uniref:uncharacterized protein n=1 Tax=Anas platyrhynchos TaxID=8839 RepID=UPI003AF1FF21